jgi:hypothetical protein
MTPEFIPRLGEHKFPAKIAERYFGRMMYAVVYIPPAIAKKLTTKSRGRVIGTVNGVLFKGGLLPAGDGKQYILLSKKYLKSSSLSIGDTTTVSLSLDDPDAVEIKPELSRALSTNPIAGRVWAQLTPGAQHGWPYRVASAKRVETQLDRIEECIDKLCDMANHG